MERLQAAHMMQYVTIASFLSVGGINEKLLITCTLTNMVFVKFKISPLS